MAVILSKKRLCLFLDGRRDWAAVAVEVVPACLVPRTSRMGEMGCRGRRSGATAEKRCIGFPMGVRDGPSVWEARIRGGEYM